MLGLSLYTSCLTTWFSHFFSILFNLISFELVILLFELVFALMNGYASCFLVCKQLWFEVEGGEEQRTTCNFWLVPLHYIPIVIYFLHVVSCVNRSMTTKPTYNHNYQHHPPLPSSSTCVAWWHGCGCPWKPPCSLRSCHDLLMAVWVWKQRSDSRTRALSVRDDEEGHLICRSGDVLQERCTHCHYSIVTILHMSIKA